MFVKSRNNRWSRLSGDVSLINPNICFCAPDAPQPDPLIGQAAKQNADIAASMRDIAKDNLAWERERAAKQDPLVEKIVNQQIESGDKNAARADEQWQHYLDLFQPVESKMVQDAMEFDSPERKERMAGEAGADTTRAYQAMQDQQARMMGRLGVNPNSGRFAALNNEMGLNQAKDTAGAMNAARRATEQQGMALRTGAAQFGRNMPNTGLAADSTALNAGNSAVGNMGANNAARAQSMNTAAQWFGGAQAGNNSAGGLMNNLYSNQLNAWNMENQNTMAGLAGLGGLMGAAGSAPKGSAFTTMLTGLRKGGVIKDNSAYGLSDISYFRKPAPAVSKSRGGLGPLKSKGYAEGGMIEGPGTGASDSIPASIEGVQPIRLSNGEAVLNKEAVDLVGEDFVHRVNAGGLMMLEKKKAPTGNSVGGLAMLAKKH